MGRESARTVVPLLRHEVRCARPRLSEKFSGCFARVLGESWDSGLGCLSCFTSPQEGFTMQLRRRLPDSRSGLIIADFTILFLPLSPALAHRDFVKIIGISCRDALSVWVGFRACFFETGALSACLAFFDLCGLP